MIMMLAMVEVTNYDEHVNCHYFDLMKATLHLLINYFEPIKCLFELIQYLWGFILRLIGFIMWLLDIKPLHLQLNFYLL